MFNRLNRDRGPLDDSVFVVMPFGKQEFLNDHGDLVVYDFDEHYEEVLVPVIKAADLVPVRTDSLFEGGDTVLENVWARLQEGKIVISDLTGANRNVMIEFGWAYMLNKKIIPLTQCGGGRAVGSAGPAVHPVQPGVEGHGADEDRAPCPAGGPAG